MKYFIFIVILLFSCSTEIDRPDNIEINIKDGVWKHSHNDYKADSPIYDALKAGCQILEYDVIYGHGEVYVTHDDKWYDSPLTYYGKLSDYLEEINYVVNQYDIILYIYIEVKDITGISAPLLAILTKYENKNIIYLPECWSDYFVLDGYTQYREFIKDKNIEVVDL